MAGLSCENVENSQDLEMAWAIKAFHHAETYFNLITSVDSGLLKLTKHDDELYEHFRKDFPDMKIDQIAEEDLKSEASKAKWRPFCNHFDGTVKDFNYGTLLRLNCNDDYSEKNSIFVTRIQFFAIEIARNREGFNQAVRKTSKHKDGAMENAKEEPAQKDQKSETAEAKSNEASATS